MYLAKMMVSDFRRLRNVTLRFRPGLNVILGANNVGKTAVIDAVRTLLGGADEYPLRLNETNIGRPKSPGDKFPGEILIQFVFQDLSLAEEAEFLPALREAAEGAIEAHFGVRYSEPDPHGRLKVRRWCGDQEEVAIPPEILENLRSVYLPPLRDASQGLKPSRASQLARLMNLLADDAGREAVNEALKGLDAELKKQQPLKAVQEAISSRHIEMLGSQLAQMLEVGLNANDVDRMAARLSLLADQFDVEQNGMGFNNLIYMAVVLSELVRTPDIAFRALLIEEPEAHLHPQLQAVLLRYLEEIDKPKAEAKGAKPSNSPVQVFVTSHSPNFASIASLDSIECLTLVDGEVDAFFPRDISFEPGAKEKLQRYLDVSRAELFFARRIIFVEGAAELLLVNVFAKRLGLDLRDHAVSVINLEGLNFDCFLPIYGKNAIRLPVAVLTDADPGEDEDEPIYPDLNAATNVSGNTAKMLLRQDEYVKIFHGVKTFEYDLALQCANRPVMIAALKRLHPRVAISVEESVGAAGSNAEKAKALFVGMFERRSNNVQKGRYAQMLADEVKAATDFVVPPYIRAAIEHVTK